MGNPDHSIFRASKQLAEPVMGEGAATATATATRSRIILRTLRS